jgi:hypothetical protein
MDAAKKVERSVDSLQKIYAVIISLALGQAIKQVVELCSGCNDLAICINVLPQFIAFVFVVVPFFHGMNRHLDFCYLEKDVNDVKQGGLLLDFLVFFIESTLFFVCAYQIANPITFFLFLSIVLAVDMIWASLSHLIHYKSFENSVLRWLVINGVAITIGYLVVLLNIYSDSSKQWALMIIVIIRTVMDYASGWQFYFPAPINDQPKS